MENHESGPEDRIRAKGRQSCDTQGAAGTEEESQRIIPRICYKMAEIAV